MAKDFMTAKEVSEYLGLSRRQVYALAAERVFLTTGSRQAYCSRRKNWTLL